MPACTDLGSGVSSMTGSGGGGGEGGADGAAGVADLSGGVTVRFLTTCSDRAAPRGGFLRFLSPPVMVDQYAMTSWGAEYRLYCH